MAVEVLAGISGCLGTIALPAQQLDPASVVQHVDAAVQARIDNVADYTATEHYAVFRNHDEVHPAAEMTVRAVYRKDLGKDYTILSESGSTFVRSQVLGSVLENEKRLSQPGNVETALIDSANYLMELQPNQPQQLDGRGCLVLALTPKRNSPYLFKGTLWVDAKDYSILQLVGTATKSPFFLTGAAQVSRQYASIDGFPMATHASAVSNSILFGQTTVKIDYSDYQVDLRPSK